MPVERLWLGNDGKYQVQASYVCLFQDKKVKLRKPNGAMIAIPLNLLCSEDIAFIATQSKLPTRDSTIKKTQKSKTLVTPELSTSSSYFSGETLAHTESQKIELDQRPHIGSEPMPLQVTTSANRQNVRHLSEDESTQMIPKRSLSSITDQFKRQTFLVESRQNAYIDIKSLANLPSRAASLISSYLDFRSRLRLSCVSRRLHQIVFKPEVWATVSFSKSDHYMVNDEYFYQAVVYLQQRGSLQKAIKHVELDGTVITSASVLLAVKYLENLEFISIQGCWSVLTYQLATELTKVAARHSDKYPSKISKVTLGKVLHRGPMSTNVANEKTCLDSKSFGQDAWFMNAALNKLTGKNVAFDVVTCGNCHIGAASQDFVCVSCGILPLKKCAGCAPRYAATELADYRLAMTLKLKFRLPDVVDAKRL
ncbi:uncharacterized protein EV154DRAFT_563459 [Mucor mucedo]|uniref:uncharacterized protein n=1 Tax=Mucor mucedo TaxID=29922 RepID=UPI00221EAE10|nr:uncharacterized protein EV154DRAFT_563459 [Mucor mucedo]KAI7891330.1 hypothetical protein EV154DRAFT_563459 [Mucor mucedo]